MSSDLLYPVRFFSRTYTSRRSLLSFLSVFGVIQLEQVLLRDLGEPSSIWVWWCGSLQFGGPLVASHFFLAVRCLQLWKPHIFTLLPHFCVFFSWSTGTEGSITLTQGVSQGTHLLQWDPVRATHISQLLGYKQQK